MQRSTAISLRLNDTTSKLFRNAATRSYSKISQAPTRTFQCISPLARPGSHSTRQAARIRWQPTRSVYTNRGSTLRERMSEVRKDSPVMFPISIAIILLGTCSAIYASYVYIYGILPIETNYPEPVAAKIKRALYYTHQAPNPQKAWDYYRQALQIAEELEMHPFSPEVLALKLKAAAMLEETNHLSESIEVLEIMRKDCLRFVGWCEAPERTDMRKHRTRVLRMAVQIGVKLGDMYSNVYTRDDDAAEKHLTDALQLLLTESHRREIEHVKEEDEGPFLSAEEIGASLESLADLYEQRNKHYLAAPLYLRAVTLAQPPSCHTAILMNNLAASLSQTSPSKPPASSGNERNDPPTSRAALISNARQWTEKALELCGSLAPAQKTDECDAACAVATHNLGEFAEMEGLVAEARKRYEEARGLAKAMGFEEGVENAEQGLRRLASEV